MADVGPCSVVASVDVCRARRIHRKFYSDNNWDILSYRLATQGNRIGDNPVCALDIIIIASISQLCPCIARPQTKKWGSSTYLRVDGRVHI